MSDEVKEEDETRKVRKVRREEGGKSRHAEASSGCEVGACSCSYDSHSHPWPWASSRA